MPGLFPLGKVNKQKRACEIAAKARDLGASMVRPGVSYLEVAEAVEDFIISSGAGVAFPTNVAVNEIAAHYTPSINDDLKFKKGDLVKIDVGAHVGGFIGDTAKTVEAGTKKHKRLIQCSEIALKKAIEAIGPGVDLGEIGGIIEDSILERGFKPIRNLAGHSIEKFCLHGALTIPNNKESTLGVVRKGDILAIEPFVTDGKKGRVAEEEIGSIYSFISKKNCESEEARMLQHIILTRNNWKFLPFCQRMIAKEADELDIESVEKGLKELVRRRVLHPYAILKEKSSGSVSQTEHTIMITKSGCEVLTKGGS